MFHKYLKIKITFNTCGGRSTPMCRGTLSADEGCIVCAGVCCMLVLYGKQPVVSIVFVVVPAHDSNDAPEILLCCWFCSGGSCCSGCLEEKATVDSFLSFSRRSVS